VPADARHRRTGARRGRAGDLRFDCGFTDRKERAIFYDWAAGLGETATLHFLDVNPETRWARVERRNAEQGDTFALLVTREMFDFMQTIWEAPGQQEAEASAVTLIRI